MSSCLEYIRGVTDNSLLNSAHEFCTDESEVSSKYNLYTVIGAAFLQQGLA